MNHFIKTNSSGVVLQTMSTLISLEDLQELLPSPDWKQIDTPAVASEVYWNNGQIKLIPAAPDDDHVFNPVSEAWEDNRELEELRISQIAKVNIAYTAATAAVNEGYPAAERESWPVQIMEARALTLDPNAPTPWLDAAAAARDADRLVLANKVIALDSAYRSIHGALSGKRQALEKQIEAATTRDAILALVW